MANNVHAQARATAVLEAPVIGPGHDFETVTETVPSVPTVNVVAPSGSWICGMTGRPSGETL